METLDLIDSSNVNSFSISVTEEIDDTYLLTFLRTHIERQNFLLNEQSYFYYFFHKSVLKYEVIVFDKHSKNSYPDIFSLQVSPQIDGVTLFLLEDSFCLYIDNELALFKKLEKVIEEDIKEYILQVYNLSIDTVVILTTQEIEQLIKEFQIKLSQKSKKKFFSYKEQKSFRYFQYFLLFATIIFLLFLYKIYNDKLEYQNYSNSIQNTKQLQVQKNLISQYKQFESQAPLKKLSPVFKNLNSLEIKILKLEYDKKRFWLQLSHSKKEPLLELIQLQKSLETKAIYFDKNLSAHVLEIELVF